MAWFEHGTSRIYYEDEGSGDPLLALPGVTLSIDDLQTIRRALNPHYRVIAADPPGSGRSGPQPREYTASYYQDDSRVFLDLLEELSASPAHIVGFSDGGEYALLMAILNPAAVRSIAAWGAAGHMEPSAGVAEMFSQVVDNPAPPLQQFSDHLRTAYGEDNARIMTRSLGKAWEAIMDAGGDISLSRAREIRCPVLLISGQDDVVVPPGLVSALAAAIPGAELLNVKGAGHAIHRERPDWLARTIVHWLAKR